ncbi:MAG: transcription-repair coupling factor [Phycisphaeraceae bacterium]|nr:transcription-repair coupling factor [Phycisphaeraceae bacterium]MCW5753956.1 transcription-repair coupling factor [Phycisphaeraceae bacterium]
MPLAATQLLDDLSRSMHIDPLVRALDEGGHCAAGGVCGSAATFLAASISKALGRGVLLVTAHTDDAEEAWNELTGLGCDALHLPALEMMPGTSGVIHELLAERMLTLRALGEPARHTPSIVVAPIHSLMQPAPPRDAMGRLLLDIRRGCTIAPGYLLDWLDRAGYVRRDVIEDPGDVAVRGGIIDIFPVGGEGPVRLDFFGDDIEQLHEIDLDTMGSDAAIEQTLLIAARIDPIELAQGEHPTALLPPSMAVLLLEPQEMAEQARGYFERVYDGERGVLPPREVLRELESRAFGIAELSLAVPKPSRSRLCVPLALQPLPTFSREIGDAMQELAALGEHPTPRKVVVTCANEGEYQRFEELRSQFAPGANIVSARVYVHRGFLATDMGGLDAQIIAPYHELLHRFQTRRRTSRLRASKTIDAFLEFAPGDYVVHTDHGIARFVGLGMIAPKRLPGRTGAGDAQEYLTLEFADRARLHVPVTQIDLVQRYVGGFKGKPPLSTLGGTRWKHQKERVRESVRDLAAELLRVRAARESLPGIRYPADTPWMLEFEAEFPYQETEDQLAAIAAIKRDMESPRPMDRLVCGDVGFGKTELAIRAAFKAVEFGKQVAVLVPTTLLSEQHERTFRERFAGYPFSVESLSRFRTGRETADLLRRLRSGQLDVVVGTHRLLSADVEFADLGLVIIDEEQRFGVEHKERLLQLRLTVDVLTLSATPIPRTLHMAMLGIRDISSLTTPPADRRAIVTEVMPYSERRISDAISRELAREGQVYYVHNRVHDIRSATDRVQRLAPSARIVTAHGQMADGELEEIMLAFIRREADILVCTTIIESGIDIPTANTMIIDDAHRFGLAELHQLRGRVGRHKHRAYCYLLLPQDRGLSDVAKRRLAAIEEYSMLGAGFKIAMRDLEIRGAGNLLGSEQSGHIAAVGYDMYCRLLEQSVRSLRNEVVDAPPSTTTVDLGITGVIPRTYIASDIRRMEAYRRIAVATSSGDLDKVETDLVTAYGSLPRPVSRLLMLARIRAGAAAIGVRSVTLRDTDIVFRTAKPENVESMMRNAPGTVRTLPPAQNDTLNEVYYRPPPRVLEGDTILTILGSRLSPVQSLRESS